MARLTFKLHVASVAKQVRYRLDTVLGVNPRRWVFVLRSFVNVMKTLTQIHCDSRESFFKMAALMAIILDAITPTFEHIWTLRLTL